MRHFSKLSFMLSILDGTVRASAEQMSHQIGVSDPEKLETPQETNWKEKKFRSCYNPVRLVTFLVWSVSCVLPITGACGVWVGAPSGPSFCTVAHWFFEHPRETKIDLKNQVFREIGCSTEGREITNLTGVIRRFESSNVREIGISLRERI